MHYTLAERNRLHTLAQQQANALRSQTESDVWHGADALVSEAGHAAYRSAQRLAYRLARRHAASAPAIHPQGE